MHYTTPSFNYYSIIHSSVQLDRHFTTDKCQTFSSAQFSQAVVSTFLRRFPPRLRNGCGSESCHSSLQWLLFLAFSHLTTHLFVFSYSFVREHRHNSYRDSVCCQPFSLCCCIIALPIFPTSPCQPFLQFAYIYLGSNKKRQNVRNQKRTSWPCDEKTKGYYTRLPMHTTWYRNIQCRAKTLDGSTRTHTLNMHKTL